MRLGYCIADWGFMSRMIASRSDSGCGALEQMVVAEYFSQNFGEHVDELSETLKGKLDTMVEALEQEFGTAVEPWVPKGGIFLWMKLPPEIDIMKTVKPAAAAGIALNPGPEGGNAACVAESYRASLFGSDRVILSHWGVLERDCVVVVGHCSATYSPHQSASCDTGHG